jgi:hypothetical protein
MRPIRILTLAVATASGMAALGAAAAPYSLLNSYREAAREINGMAGLRFTTAGIVMKTDSPLASLEGAALTIYAKGGVRTVHPDADGVLVIPEDAALVKENPEFSLPKMGEGVNLRLTLQPFVRAPIALAGNLDVVSAMQAEYASVLARFPQLRRANPGDPTTLRIVPKEGAPLSATTSCGVVFGAAGGGVLQAPLTKFPKGCTLRLSGNAERLELGFAEGKHAPALHNAAGAAPQ